MVTLPDECGRRTRGSQLPRASCFDDARQFLAHLCALVPPPGFHMTRNYGVLASHHRLREHVVPKPAAPPPPQLPLDFALPSDPAASSPRPRRIGWANHPRSIAPPSAGVVEFGRLRVDTDAHMAWVDGAEVGLTALEFRLLLLLLGRRGWVQTREVLLGEVWGAQSFETTRTVDTHVQRLRKKLGDAADYVPTVRGIGYRFIAHPTKILTSRDPGDRQGLALHEHCSQQRSGASG